MFKYFQKRKSNATIVVHLLFINDLQSAILQVRVSQQEEQITISPSTLLRLGPVYCPGCAFL